MILLFSFLLSSQWDIDTTYSYIKYTGNHPLHSWSGVSKDIDFIFDCSSSKCILKISTALENFDSGNDSRDSNMLYYTESLLHPVVSFKSDPFNYSGEVDKSIDVKGILSFHGISKEIPVKIFLDNKSWGTCNFKFNLSTFNVERPSLLMLKIDETIEIETKLKLVKIQS